jgi:hypothetical protein
MRSSLPSSLRLPMAAAVMVTIAAVLSGCGSDDEPRRISFDVPLGGEDLALCGGNGFVRYIGVPLLLPGDRIPKSGTYLHIWKLPHGSRVVTPKMVVTMEHIPDRLNVMVDETGHLLRLYCG